MSDVIETGLGSLLTPIEVLPEAVAVEPTPEPAKTDPIKFDEPPAPGPSVATDSPDQVSPAMKAELNRLAKLDAEKRAFVEQVLAARTQPVAEYKTPPVPPRVMEQTRLEMELGAKMNEVHAAARLNAPVRRAEKVEGSTPIFRPADYVPDQKKGQGNIKVEGRNL